MTLFIGDGHIINVGAGSQPVENALQLFIRPAESHARLQGGLKGLNERGPALQVDAGGYFGFLPAVAEVENKDHGGQQQGAGHHEPGRQYEPRGHTTRQGRIAGRGGSEHGGIRHGSGKVKGDGDSSEEFEE